MKGEVYGEISLTHQHQGRPNNGTVCDHAMPIFHRSVRSQLLEFHLPPLPLANAAKEDPDGEDGADDAEDDQRDVAPVRRVVQVCVEIAQVANGNDFNRFPVQFQAISHQLLAPDA